MVRIISFDLDGTLMQPDFGNMVWLEGLPRIYAREKNIHFAAAKKELMQAYDQLGKERREWYDLLHWIKKLHLSITPQDLLAIYKKFIKPYPETKEVVSNLSKHYSLIISSSAMKEFITMELEQTGLRQYFSHIYSSTSDTDYVKKNPAFYRMICSRLQISPSELVHVGDTKLLDVDAPRKIGIISYYLNRETVSEKRYVIRSLKELEADLLHL
jgi:putative hydrolase of the HAD superfamily